MWSLSSVISKLNVNGAPRSIDSLLAEHRNGIFLDFIEGIFGGWHSTAQSYFVSAFFT